MIIDTEGALKGVIGKKLPADSTLKNLSKEKLIELLHISEDYYTVLLHMYENATKGSATIIETVYPDSLDCEVPSDYFDSIKEVRVIDEWTEESKVFQVVNSRPWIPCNTGNYPKDYEDVEITFLNFSNGTPETGHLAYREHDRWCWSIDGEALRVEVTAWRPHINDAYQMETEEEEMEYENRLTIM